jgi:hypothetical protein
MSKVEDGGPAFPQHVAISPSGDVYGSSYYGEGMSLRDYFAGAALAGMIGSFIGTNEKLARNAYDVADAMIAARQGQGGGS